MCRTKKLLLFCFYLWPVTEGLAQFNGGINDGFAMACFSQTNDPGWDIFSGGNNDGFAVSCFTQADDPGWSIFSGGVNDGFGFASQMLALPVPIELIDFAATIKDKQVILTWQTATEINNDYFTVEKSKTATEWQPVATVDGAGTSTKRLHYIVIDEAPFPGIAYYRLKQTDFDGRFTYSAIVSVNLDNPTVVIYPNPTHNRVVLQANKTELERIVVINTLGEDVTWQVIQITKSDEQCILDFGRLPKGLYLIKTTTSVSRIYKN